MQAPSFLPPPQCHDPCNDESRSRSRSILRAFSDMYAYPGHDSKTSSLIASLIAVRNEPSEQKYPEGSSPGKRSSNYADIKWVPTGKTVNNENNGDGNGNGNGNDPNGEEGRLSSSGRAYDGASLLDLCPRTSDPGSSRNGQASNSLWSN